MSKNQSLSKDQIFALFGKHVSSGKAKYFRDYGLDFVLGRREGARMWDLENEHELINCHCNGGVFNLGHRNPEVLAALQESLQKYDIGNHHLVSGPRAELAALLAELTPGNLQYTIFGVSGGEAIDTAIKIARAATGRRQIISVEGGYHGHTGLALAAGADKFSAPFLSTDSEFIKIPFNDLDALTKNITEQTAAVLIETIPATSGMLLPDQGYLNHLRTVCSKHGALYIADEVQAGLGRTGVLWAVDKYQVEPDILVIGKGLSGGIYPITATVIAEPLEKVFHEDPFLHISTFGGSELGCAVARKVLEMTAEPEFLSRINRSAERLREGLEEIRKEADPYFVKIEGTGMMLGLRMMLPEMGMLMSKMAYDAGLFCIYSGLDTAVLQFLPPLIADDALVDEILERLKDAFRRASEFVSGGGSL